MLIKSLTHDGKTYTQYEPERLLELGVPETLVQEAVIQQELDDIHQQRRNAYVEESDHLFLEWQYDLSPQSEAAWRNKVTEIKLRYPLPVGVVEE